jgi:hypothetical protein
MISEVSGISTTERNAARYCDKDADVIGVVCFARLRASRLIPDVSCPRDQPLPVQISLAFSSDISSHCSCFHSSTGLNHTTRCLVHEFPAILCADPTIISTSVAR